MRAYLHDDTVDQALLDTNNVSQLERLTDQEIGRSVGNRESRTTTGIGLLSRPVLGGVRRVPERMIRDSPSSVPSRLTAGGTWDERAGWPDEWADLQFVK